MAPSTTDVISQSSNPDLVVSVRRTSFDAALAGLDKHFAADANLFESHMTAVLSSTFPDGEDFFVRAVRHYRSAITDPILKRQVSGFIGQEAVHGREHRDVNERLAELGYPTVRNERITNRALVALTKHSKPIDALAVTAAVEHFTASLAEMILDDDDVRRRYGDGLMGDLFTWHALEESEHKAVTFDVYRAVGGTERDRVNIFRIVRFVFAAAVLVGTLESLARDRSAWSLRRLRRDLAGFKGSALVSKRFWALLKEYERPGFHPNDRNTDELVEFWSSELFGDEGRLRSLVAS